ncbi:hypothetical protein NHQ30_004119 [Ciborinia camelliae]|nr:hypothetical protein NHQ30_004119 [Ciborinia camelliae]
MDFSSGLGLSFGTNDEQQNFNNMESGESSDNNDQDQQMEDNGESSEDPMSFRSQDDDDPDTTPRPSSTNQFTSNNPNSFGTQVQPFSQPYRQSQSSVPFHLSGNDAEYQTQMNTNFGFQPNAFTSQVSAPGSYMNNFANHFAQGVPQNLQFGADSQFNGHGHAQPGFQNRLNQPRSDSQNVFGNSGMHNNTQNNMSSQAMQQSNVKGEPHNDFQMTGYPPPNNNLSFDSSQMNQHEFNQRTPRLNDTFQSHLGSSMNHQFQPMSSATQHMSGNQMRNQVGNQGFSSSFATQANMNQMLNNPQMMANSQNKNEQARRSNFPFSSSNSVQENRKMNNTSNVRSRQSNLTTVHSQPLVPHNIDQAMRATGLNPKSAADVEIFRDRLNILRERKIQQAQMKAEAKQQAGRSRGSSGSTVTHHSMGRNESMHQEMGQGQAWANQFGQGHTANPFQSQGNATSGPQMNNHTSQPAFPPIPSHLVLGSNNARQPVFGQHPQDYTQLSINNPIQPDPTPYIPLGSAQLISASDNLTSQQLRQQLRPPTTLQQSSVGVQNQQQQSQFRLHPLQSSGNAQFNQYGRQQQFHHHGLPHEYNPPHGPRPNNFADNGVESAETIDEDWDEQQEEGSEPEQQQAEQEEQEQQQQEEEQDSEVDSDGFSIYSDEVAPPPPNEYPIPRPLGAPGSPVPRFPSNEVNPNNAPNRPPPIIGGGNKVWSIAPNAFNANGNIKDWNKAKRRLVGNGLECECRGTIHQDGAGFYMATETSYIWCYAGEKDYESEEENEDEDENGDENENEKEKNGEDSEEDEELRGVPKWVKQVLTDGPRIDKDEVRREEDAYRMMMAEKVKKLLARKAARERGEVIPEENENVEDNQSMDFDMFFNDAVYRGEDDANQSDRESQGKAKRKERSYDSDDDTEAESPVKKWKGKGKAADSDEELDEVQVAIKYTNKDKGKGKVKFFDLPDKTAEDLLFGDSEETARLAQELGLEPNANAEEIDDDDNDSIFGGANTTQDSNNIELETESAIADPDLAATGVILPASFPLPSNPNDEEEIEEVPRQAPYISRRNEGTFNIFQSLLLTPEVVLEFMRHLSPKQLLALYCLSRRFNEILSGWMAHSIISIVKYQAPYSYKIYPFALYRELSIPDPIGRLNKSGGIRRIPGLKYHQMVLHRVRVVRDILAALARQHLRCPPGTNHSLKKVWFLMDLSTTLDRVRLIHNREFFTDQDLFNIQHFIVKLDMRFNDPTDGPGTDMLRKLMLGQRGLTPLCRLLARTGFTDLYELQSYIVRYTYDPIMRADDVTEGMFDVPYEEIGRGHLEGWGKGEKHLMRIDELVMREATRRELGFKEHIAMMFLWGYVDPITGENLQPSEQECYMSDGEGEEVEPEGDPWEGTGMNMARLESLVLGTEESDSESESEEDGDGDEWEDEDEEAQAEARRLWS